MIKIMLGATLICIVVIYACSGLSVMGAGITAPGQTGRAKYLPEINEIRVEGAGNTLETIIGQVANESLIRFGRREVFLGANIRVAAGGEIVLGNEILVKDEKAKKVTISVDKGGTVRLTGRPIVQDIGLEGIKDWSFSGEQEGVLTVNKTVCLAVTLKDGKPLVDAKIEVTAKDKNTGGEVCIKGLLLDKEGKCYFSPPACTVEIKSGRVEKIDKKISDIQVDDVSVLCQYVIRDVDISSTGDLKVVFTGHRSRDAW